MSVVTLLQRRPQRLLGPSPEEGGLLIDAVLEEAIALEADYTTHPIEIGAEITDHVIPKPGVYTLTGVVSDHPLKWFTTSYQHGDSRIRHLSAYAILRDLFATQQLFDIEQTGYLDLEDVFLAGFTSKKDASLAHTFRFEATVVQIIVVETKERKITADMVDAGTQAEQVIEPEPGGQINGEETTLLKDIKDAIAGGAKSAFESIAEYFE